MDATQGSQHGQSQPIGSLVFIHGSGDNAHVWDGVIERLSDFATVALDLPGHGAQVERPGPSDMRVEDYAGAVRAELTRRGLSGVCLIGHSLGSAIALRLAVDHPSLVRRLVLVGSGARLRVLPALLEAARAQSGAAGTNLTELGFAEKHAPLAKSYLAARAAPAPGVLYRDLAACDRFDIMPELGHIAQPTLILTGQEDRLTPPKYATYLRDHLEHAQLALLPDAGHYVMIEAPDAVAGAIRGWLG